MYIKRILLVIVIAGMLVGGAFAFMVYRAFFVPNTQFGNEVAYVFIPSNSDFQEVKSIMEPLLKDLKTFESAAD
ncbi:MAG TPA: aminodeoxychorismate lyase, partial [Arenibacter sp.]|nr:aminodeoxychorismate lyase [Arenibacter sp.]